MHEDIHNKIVYVDSPDPFLHPHMKRKRSTNARHVRDIIKHQRCQDSAGTFSLEKMKEPGDNMTKNISMLTFFPHPHKKK